MVCGAPLIEGRYFYLEEYMAPNSQLYICKGIPWDNDYTHVRLFDSAQAANSFILAHKFVERSRYNYVSKDNTIRVDGYSDQYKDCNYIAFNNVSYNNKWYYAFITDIKYINDGSCLITFEEDVFQTWFYDASVRACFVEREHVNDDTIGANTVPENIVMGDPVLVNTYLASFPHMWFMYVSQLAPGIEDLSLEIISPGDTANKTSGFYKIKLGMDLTSIVSQVVDLYTKNGMLEAISSVFAATDVLDSDEPDIALSPVDTFAGYTPKNNKLLCYPYNYCTLVMAGSETPYRFEYFPNRKALFALAQSDYPGGSGYVYPISYQMSGGARDNRFNLENSVITGAYPTASFGASQFQNYLVQQGPSIAIGLAGNLAATVGGVATLGATGGLAGGGAYTSGVTGIANTIADIYKHSLVSETVKGTQAVSNIAYEDALYIRLKNMQVKPEYAKIIDDYLSAFGYKICRIKAPNITGRASWNFVKTIDANVVGDIPDRAGKKLRQLFDRGITIWHTNDVGNYSLDNSITG